MPKLHYEFEIVLCEFVGFDADSLAEAEAMARDYAKHLRPE
jgi:hypothetical protein